MRTEIAQRVEIALYVEDPDLARAHFDDFAAAGSDNDLNRKVLGI